MKSQDWQQQLADAFSDPEDLLEALDLRPILSSETATSDFAFRVPRGFAARMKKGDQRDPLLLQVLPQIQEMDVYPGYSHDPVRESKKMPLPGLIHKYHGRVLLTVTGGCAINCRYCFRRHFAYKDNVIDSERLSAIIDYLQKDASINEVILSGGDPLTVKDGRLQEIIQQIESVPHVTQLRIHTRLPIVLPDRITEDFLKLLTQSRLQPVIVVHCNHANEIDETVLAAIDRCRRHKIPVLNQTVLLQDVNDTAETQVALAKALFSAGIMPYYLHVLDQVRGAAHFYIGDERARLLHKQMQEKLPGYMVPKLVKEVAGEPHKTLL